MNLKNEKSHINNEVSKVFSFFYIWKLCEWIVILRLRALIWDLRVNEKKGENNY